MPNMGPAEILILAIVGLVVVLGIGMIAIRAGARGPIAWRSPGMLPPVSAELQHRVRELYQEGRVVEAVKEIREQTGLGLREAKALADTLAAGHALPTVATAPGQPDLATRVRELKAAGRTEQAVLLVRGETGMGQAEAETFVKVL
ncbi:50S ribosomal protein L7/L12 [Microbispora sp. NPDC049125]|uniref:50S ribosomal protein L7/L12 n=1 Tax=Microbispora sp. NPDC049125 TaxID=3154929 RepID=UPI003465E324